MKEKFIYQKKKKKKIVDEKAPKANEFLFKIDFLFDAETDGSARIDKPWVNLKKNKGR